MRKIPAVVAAIAATAALAHPAAAAATTGGPIYFAHSTNLAWSASGQNMTCTDVTFGGTVESGTDPAATVDSYRTAWHGCRYSGADVVVTFKNYTWNLVADSGYTTAATDTAVAAHIANIGMHWNFLGGLCTFDVFGSMQATLDEATQTLHVNETAAHGGLTVTNTSFGCFGFILNGSHLSLSAEFAINPIGDPINVS